MALCEMRVEEHFYSPFTPSRKLILLLYIKHLLDKAETNIQNDHAFEINSGRGCMQA